ncbi:zinc ribbon domain-containing protein [Amycolatopsis sp. NPDC051128]
MTAWPGCATPSSYPRQSRPPLKTCPDCANEVRLAARKCQYCSYEFAGRS